MTRPLRVGIQLPEVEREVRWPEMVELARTIEDAGFDAIWVGEHLLYRWPDIPARGPWEAWTMLAALAASTTRVSLGPLVAATSFHNPALLAKQAATIDEIAGGRFVLGLGAGWNETEFRAFGFTYDHRIDRFEEAFTIIRTLLQEGRIDYEGRFYQARDCELLPRPRPGGPPLLIGSNGPRMLRIVAPHVQAWNTWYADTDNRPEGVARLKDIVDAAARDVGRDPAEIARTVAVHVRMRGGQGRTMGDTSTTRRIVPLEGPPEVIAEGLRAYAAVGVSEVQVVLDPIDRRSVERFAAVLPILDRG
jgi:probable F420-dependent oxidoreductase